MREAKFRGLSVNNEWFFGNVSILKKPLVGMHSVSIGSYISNSNGLPFAYQVRPETVGQFTGLKDKNGKGKEIYHKDVIINHSRNNGNPHIVEWSDIFGGWIGLYNGLAYLIAQELHEIEVIGNKFMNLELLKS